MTGGGLCSWKYCSLWYKSGGERWCPNCKSWRQPDKVSVLLLGFNCYILWTCTWALFKVSIKNSLFRYDGLHHGSSYLEHLNFLSAIRAKGIKAPAVDLQDGLISVAIGVAAQLSIEKGRFVTIDEVLGERNCKAWWF